MTRRQLLLGAGTGAAGLALGAAATAVGIEEARASHAQDAETTESAGGAGPYGRPGRLGSRQVIWSAHPIGRVAAVSFDDGPTPQYTPRILDALAAAGVYATFFVMGYNADRHPDLIRRIVDEGHEIGNHTWSHLDQTTLDSRQIRQEIVRCKDVVEQIIQKPLVGYRPPRGELTGYAMMVCAELGYDAFLWSVTRGPGGTSTPAAVQKYVGHIVQPGDIVDLHDGLGRGTFSPAASFTKGLAARREVEVRALPGALKQIAARGITLVTITDLVRRSSAAQAPV